MVSAPNGVPNQLIRLCHVQATGQELKIGDIGVKRFPLCLTSSIKFNGRHDRILLCFEVCFELSDNSLKNVFFYLHFMHFLQIRLAQLPTGK